MSSRSSRLWLFEDGRRAVASVAGEELVVGALLDDATSVKDEDAVGEAHSTRE